LLQEDDSSINESTENQSDESNIESGEASISANVPSEQNTQTNKSLTDKIIFSNIPRSRKRSLSIEETRVSEAYNILKSTVQANKQKDCSDVFGDYVARKLRKYNVKTQSYVEHQINNILFEADMELHNNFCDDTLTSPSPSSSPQILQSATVLPMQTLNNNDMYIISDSSNIQDILKKYNDQYN